MVDDMKRWWSAYGIALAVFLVLDGVWIPLVAQPIYRSGIGPLLASQFQCTALLENDIMALALAENVYGIRGKYANFLELVADAGIGGGLCGVLCAWFLKQAGVDYVLVEGDAVGRGVTCNTTAKITSQHGLIYEKLLRTQGKEKALQYLDGKGEAPGYIIVSVDQQVFYK